MIGILNRKLSLALGAVALLALAATGITFASQRAFAGSDGQCTGSDSDGETNDGAAGAKDTGDGDGETNGGAAGSQDTGDGDGEADDGAAGAKDTGDGDGETNDGCDAGETQVAPGQLDDGKELLPQAGISLDKAVAAAQAAASGTLGEVDLEYYQGKLVFNVDVGTNDVKVDAANGAIVNVGPG